MGRRLYDKSKNILNQTVIVKKVILVILSKKQQLMLKHCDFILSRDINTAYAVKRIIVLFNQILTISKGTNCD